MQPIDKKYFQDLLKGFEQSNNTVQSGSIEYWQNRGAINLINSILLIMFK